jgi:hypothetical protein
MKYLKQGLLVGALALAGPLQAGAPVFVFNGTDQSWRVQLDRQAELKAAVLLEEVDGASLEATGNRVQVTREPRMIVDDAPSLVLNPGKAMRISMDNPAGSRLKFPLWIQSRDAGQLDNWLYTFQVVSDMTQASPRAAIREFYASADFKLPFGMQALSGTELKIVPKGGEEDKAAAGKNWNLPELNSKSGSSCTIL